MTFTLLPSSFSWRCISGRSSRIHHPFESSSWSNAGDSASCNSSCSSFTGGISVPGSVPTSLPSAGSSCRQPGQTWPVSCFLFDVSFDFVGFNLAVISGPGDWTEETGRGCGRGCTRGYSDWGSRPTSCRRPASNWMPLSVRKHSRIIQRRGMRARLCRVSFATEPPPISTYASSVSKKLGMKIIIMLYLCGSQRTTLPIHRSSLTYPYTCPVASSLYCTYRHPSYRY